MAAFPRTDLPTPRAADARATASARRFAPTVARDGEFDAAAQLAAIVESSDDAIIGKDLDGTITSWNPAAERLYGYAAAEATGAPIAMLAPSPAGIAEIEEILEKVGRGELIDHMDTMRRRKDGRLVEVAVSISPIRDRWGVVAGASTMARDVGPRRRAERERDRALRASAELSARLAAIVDSSEDAIVGMTLDGTITSWNAGAERIYHYDRVEMLGRPVTRLAVNDEQRADVQTVVALVAGGEATKAHETVARRKDGVMIDVMVSVSPIRDPAGAVIGVASVGRDITESKRAAVALADAEQHLRRAFDHAPIGMGVIDGDGRIEQANTALAQICGRRDAEMPGGSLWALLHRDDADVAREGIAALRRRAGDRLSLELRLVRADGRVAEIAIHCTLLDPGADAPTQILCQCEDVTVRKRSEQRLRFMADHDPLTRVANRRRFQQALDQHIAAVARHGAGGAVIILDVDAFKSINDTFGHGAGDEVIVSVAGALRGRLRETDVLARLGGDEFAILLTQGGETEARRVAAALNQAVRACSGAPGRAPGTVTASIGVAVFEPGRTAPTGAGILGDADQAMYRAKQSGSDGYAVHRG